MISPELLTDTCTHSPYTGIDTYQEETFGTTQTMAGVRIRTKEEITAGNLGETKKAVYTMYFDFSVSTPATYTKDSFSENDKVVYNGKTLRVRTVEPAQSMGVVEFVKVIMVGSNG